MRTAFFVLLAILILDLGVSAQKDWTLSPSGTNNDLIAVFFTSSDRGWIAGDAGYLASTVDGGGTWTPFKLNVTADINEIYFRNEDNGYLVAGRKLFITNDAGRTWQETRIFRTGEFGSGTPEFLSIKFSDKKHGYVVGSVYQKNGDDEVVVDSLVMRTENGGETWQRIKVPAKVELYHLDFSGNSRGWIAGDNGLILATRDAGLTWNVQSSGTTMPLYNVDFRDDNEGFIVGKSGTVLRTENGGTTWSKVPTGYTETLMRVDFADNKNGWIVGYSGSVLRSADKGRTWIKQSNKTDERLYGLYMDKKYGWAVGANGAILRYVK